MWKFPLYGKVVIYTFRHSPRIDACLDVKGSIAGYKKSPESANEGLKMSDHFHDCIVNDHSPAYHIGHNEGQGVDLLSALGISHTDTGHSFIGHFLGTDSCGHHVQNFDFGHNSPQDSAGSTNPAHVLGLETLKLNWNHALAGIKFSRNILFFIIFGAMFSWLCAVNWIRHNEPNVNSALGMGAGSAPAETQPAPQTMSPTDRALLDGTRHAMPVPAPMVAARQATLSQYYIVGQGAPNSVTQTFGQQAQSSVKPSQAPFYHVPVQESAGVRLKTIVTR